jgi:hypothetical protein
MTRHFVSESCAGEDCGICRRRGNTGVAATHKVGEEILDGAPPELYMTHNLTQYICCAHFGEIFGPASVWAFRGCEVSDPLVKSPPGGLKEAE